MTHLVDLEATVRALHCYGHNSVCNACQSSEAALRALPSVGEACPTCGGDQSHPRFISDERTIGWTNTARCRDPFHTQPLSPGGPAPCLDATGSEWQGSGEDTRRRGERPEVAPITEAGLAEAIADELYGDHEHMDPSCHAMVAARVAFERLRVEPDYEAAVRAIYDERDRGKLSTISGAMDVVLAVDAALAGRGK